MTSRSEWQHRVAEAKTRLTNRIAGHLFSTRNTPLNRLVKKLMRADRDPQHADADLEHPPAP